jgi:dTDP-glucose pyrophosphorylase
LTGGKAVVLARGLGSRMREQSAGALTGAQAAAADAGAKAMMPLPGRSGARPFLDYILSGLADAGYDEVCLVVAPDHEVMRRYYTRESPATRVRVSFVVQAEPRGTADAVAAARAWTGRDHFLVVNGDNYYPRRALEALRSVPGAGTVLFPRRVLLARSNIPAERIRAFALCTADAEGWLTDIVEKPTAEQALALGDALVSMNCWRMPPSIHDACARVTRSVRGELELADAVRWLIRVAGVPFRVLVSEEGVLDLSRRDDVTTVMAALAAVAVSP